MGIMTGKKGIIFGVSNTHGIAYGIAEQLYKEGAEIVKRLEWFVKNPEVFQNNKELFFKTTLSNR